MSKPYTTIHAQAPRKKMTPVLNKLRRRACVTSFFAKPGWDRAPSQAADKTEYRIKPGHGWRLCKCSRIDGPHYNRSPDLVVSEELFFKPDAFKGAA